MKMWAFSVNTIWRKWAWKKFWNTSKRYRRGALPAELISQLGPGHCVVINSWMMDESPRWIIFGRHPPLPSYLLQSFVCFVYMWKETIWSDVSCTRKQHKQTNANLVWVSICIFLKATSISLETPVNAPLALQQGFFASKVLFKDRRKNRTVIISFNNFFTLYLLNKMNYNRLQDREKICEKIINACDTSVTHWCSALSFACLADRISRFCLSISSKRERQSKECKNWSKTVRSRDKGTFTFHEVEWTKEIRGKVTRLKKGSLKLWLFSKTFHWNRV